MSLKSLLPGVLSVSEWQSIPIKTDDSKDSDFNAIKEADYNQGREDFPHWNEG